MGNRGSKTNILSTSSIKNEFSLQVKRSIATIRACKGGGEEPDSTELLALHWWFHLRAVRSISEALL